MRFSLGAAALLSLFFIVEAAAIAGIAAGAIGLIEIPAVDPQVAAIIVVGIGLLMGFGFVYKSYS